MSSSGTPADVALTGALRGSIGPARDGRWLLGRRHVATLGRPGHRQPDRHRDGQRGRDRGTRRDRAAALDAAGAGADVGDGEGGAVQRVGRAVQGVVDAVLEGSVHRASSPDSWGLSDWGARARSAASARLACDFTVREMPSTSAISASLSCS